MPNGGVPIHMVIESGAIVIYCHAAQVQVFSADAWHQNGSEGIPLATLDPEDSGVLAWFIREWAGEELLQPSYRREGFAFDY